MSEEKVENTMNAEPTRGSVRRDGHFHPRRMSGRGKLFLSLGGIVLFGAGTIIGAGLTVLYFKNSVRPKPPEPEEFMERLMTRMNNTINLSADEDRQVRDIVQDNMQEVKRIRRESSDNIRGCFDEMRNELEKVLGPERSERWEEELYKNRPERKRKPGHDRGPRRGHH
jgi:hypothetical protein